MKNKTPTSKAEVLCKALEGELHINLTGQNNSMQWLTALPKLTPEAAAIVAYHLDGGKHG